MKGDNKRNHDKTKEELDRYRKILLVVKKKKGGIIDYSEEKESYKRMNYF